LPFLIVYWVTVGIKYKPRRKFDLEGIAWPGRVVFQECSAVK